MINRHPQSPLFAVLGVVGPDSRGLVSSHRASWPDLLGKGLSVLEKLLHHKLLNEGLEGQGVITARKLGAPMSETGAGGFYIDVEGHIKFDDRTQAVFSSRRLDPHKLGDLDVGAIVPVRYSADHQHVVLDTPKLEALRTAKQREAAGWAEQRRQRDIAAADAKLAQGSKHPDHD